VGGEAQKEWREEAMKFQVQVERAESFSRTLPQPFFSAHDDWTAARVTGTTQ
jgi:hypothetical protein